MIYLADATDKKVNALYSLLEKELKEPEFSLTAEHVNILNKREADYLSGKSKPSPWQEVHKRIRNKNKSALWPTISYCSQVQKMILMMPTIGMNIDDVV